MSSEHKDRLAALRARLAATGLDGFIIPRADEYLGEYVPPCADRLAWITGFTGSAGLAIVLAEGAAVFSDGRYTLQLQQETDPDLWERRHIIEDKPEAWLRAHAEGKRIGYDPWLISPEGLKRFAGVELVPVQSNPIDEIWADRPAPPLAPAVPHPEEYAGESAAAKRARLAAKLRAAGQDAAILTDPASLAWLFNIRGDGPGILPLRPRLRAAARRCLGADLHGPGEGDARPARASRPRGDGAGSRRPARRDRGAQGQDGAP